VQCPVQSSRTALECGVRFLPDDKGSGARGQGEKANSAFGVWLTYSLAPVLLASVRNDNGGEVIGWLRGKRQTQ
jgi:hypothetical protein